MTTKTAFALAVAAFLLLAALPAPFAQAGQVKACVPVSDYIQMVVADASADGDVWPPVQGWNPRPPWGWSADVQAAVEYEEGCLIARSNLIPPEPAEGRMQQDADGDGMGDDWTQAWQDLAGQAIQPLVDLDGDGLLNVREFQWELVPVCITGLHQNCADRESSPTSGSGGDAWLDGAEVAYWNDPNNDFNPTGSGYAFYDDDRLLDSDADGKPNVQDPDSDGDGLLDGEEHATYGTYPELGDSDCATAPCTLSSSTSYRGSRSGAPGAGDGIPDGAELAAWGSAWGTNHDGDAFPNNLLDPDSDDDGLRDGQEFLQGGNQANPADADTDNDGVLDGAEDSWSADSDGDGWRNVADTDSDGDGMPDKWEKDNGLRMANAADAGQDRDGDGLVNLHEHQHATDPNDMDSEDDRLLDGEEVDAYGTDPLFWDSDADGMPDSFEAQYALDPLSGLDAGLDMDGDSFDQDLDGQPELLWSNLQEYRYARPAGYDEAAQGPWGLGTSPRDWDTDDDAAPDGYEAHYGTDATFPLDGDSDNDDDGLNFTQEARRGTNPLDPDTDGDGLCDGGRGLMCLNQYTFSAGGYPGERDYGSTPWMTDSDQDTISDGEEAFLMWDIGMTGSAEDSDGDLLNGVIDADSDNDGLKDNEGYAHGTDARLADSDADGLQDGEEVLAYLTSPTDSDHDDDGLQDGAEVRTHRTRPRDADTDDDGLGDGAEVNLHGTDPFDQDTDQDRLMDKWEVDSGTQPLVKDTWTDYDNDELGNYLERIALTSPVVPDTDGDKMPDGYEYYSYRYPYALSPTIADGLADEDDDGLANIDEFLGGTLATWPDSDADGLQDGFEANTAGTDPLLHDSDRDWLGDGFERSLWEAQSYPWSGDADGDTLNGLRDRDSDNDGLTDKDELRQVRTKPHVQDSDGDTLSDFDEVVTYGGRFNPNDPDTDDDGVEDGIAASLLDPEGDTDQDGLKNVAETDIYATDPTEPDSDCDGVQDGPEAGYWGYYWNDGGNRLLNADVDGDSLKDGVELGTVGSADETLYRTDPALADTDGDGLDDDEEAQNSVRVSCDQPQGASQSSNPFAAPSLFPQGPPESILSPSGLVLVKDALGWFIRGGYGVRLYLADVSVEQVLVQQAGPAAGKNGKTTHPTLFDTDLDGLGDGLEVDVKHSDPTACDSDGDGLGDGLEGGAVREVDRESQGLCAQRDLDPSTVTDPTKPDSDNDGLLDSTEDANRNGILDAGESSPVDGDTDNDGLLDTNEGVFGTLFNVADTDRDGLSDGLEVGLASPQTDLLGLTWTALDAPLVDCSGTDMRTAWQPFQGASGILTNPTDADNDNDGILDGLEDLNHNGVFGDNGELHARDADHDDDGIADGVELLLWGQSNEDGSLTYTFCDIAHADRWGTDEGAWDERLAFDSSTADPFQTNPRSANTDSGINSDLVPDGKDLNPRGDAFFALEFGGLRMQNPPDTNWGCYTTWDGKYMCSYFAPDWWMEPYVKRLKVTLPVINGALTVENSPRVDNVWTREMQDFPSALLDKVANVEPSQVPFIAGEQVWKIRQLGTNALAINIPDDKDIGQVDLSDTKGLVELDLMDYDFDSPDDDVDLNPANDVGTLVQEFSLALDNPASFDPATYLSMSGEVREHRGNYVDSAAERNEDGILQIRTGDTVPKFFLEKLKLGSLKLPEGTCHGESSCLPP